MEALRSNELPGCKCSLRIGAAEKTHLIQHLPSSLVEAVAKILARRDCDLVSYVFALTRWFRAGRELPPLTPFVRLGTRFG